MPLVLRAAIAPNMQACPMMRSSCVRLAMPLPIIRRRKVRSTPRNGRLINRCHCLCCSCAKTTALAFPPKPRRAGLLPRFAPVPAWNILPPTVWICLPHLPRPKTPPNMSARAASLRFCTCAPSGFMAMRARIFPQLTCPAPRSRRKRRKTRCCILCGCLTNQARCPLISRWRSILTSQIA